MTDAGQLITYSQASTGHGDFRCSRRTAAHIDYTKEVLRQRHPGATFVIIQGCYHRGVGVSEGTHDYDCCLDVRITGLSWLEGQGFCRALGWGGWWRRPWQGLWADHIHMFSLGFEPYDIKVGQYVDGGITIYGHKVTSSQVEDYYRHSWGLSGMHVPGADTSWFPPDIKATVFDYESWKLNQEDNVPYKDWPLADKKAMMDDVRKQVDASMVAMLNNFGDRAKVDSPEPGTTEKWTMAQYMRRLFRRTGTAPIDD